MSPVTIEIQNIGGNFAGEVKEQSGTSPMSCFQCTKCSCGCPISARADIKPHELVRLVQTNQRDAALTSTFIWECTSCQTCFTRCPQQVDIASINDALRSISLQEKKTSEKAALPVFNETFLDAIRKRGRIHEISLMASLKLKTKRFMEDFDKAPKMLKKGKLPLFGSKAGSKSEREELFRRSSEGGKR
jgi:heterodisulfide reductase subunit C